MPAVILGQWPDTHEISDVVGGVHYPAPAGFMIGETLHVDSGHSAGHQAFIGGLAARPHLPRKAIMPIVTIQITREGSTSEHSAATSEQKAALIKGASQLLLDVLNKPLDATYVVIEEVEMENWGVGGLSVPEFRKQRKVNPK